MTHALHLITLAGTLAATAARAATVPSSSPAAAGPRAATAAAALDDAGEGWAIDATVPVALVSGHTTYRIAARNAAGGFASELEFPLRATLAGLRLRLSSPAGDDGGRWVVEGSALHSLDEAAGRMKDSDWFDGAAETATPPGGVGASHDGKDIFSTSRAMLRALVVEARLGRRYALSPWLRVTPAAGVLYQRLSYRLSNLHQVGYGPFDPYYTVDVAGPVLRYRVHHLAPYVGGRAEVVRGGFSAAVDGWFSPFAHARDWDDHLLRSKVLASSVFGTAWQVGAEGRVALGASDAVGVQASFLRFSADGHQHQRFYAGPNEGWTTKVAARLTSERLTLLASWTRRF